MEASHWGCGWNELDKELIQSFGGENVPLEERGEDGRIILRRISER
jgi:hypothetical protein